MLSVPIISNLLHHMHALAVVNIPIRGWNVYQTHSGREYFGGDLSDDAVGDAG